ncbi:MAG TPA: PQQ-dependent sugar dehydrogenase [Gemmataceae bacterium]|jgi:glucose/arabinose dehydrogenase
MHGDRAVPFAAGLDAPRAAATWNDLLFVVDRRKVWRVDRNGKVQVHSAADVFRDLRGVTVDERGVLYVLDADGDGAVYRIPPRGKVDLVADGKAVPLGRPRSLLMDGLSHVLLFGEAGELLRLKLADRTVTKVYDGVGGGTGLAWDWRGRLYLTTTNGVFVIARPGDRPEKIASGFTDPGGPSVSADGHTVYVPDTAAGTLTAVALRVPSGPVDETPLPLETEVAFPELQWAGWTGETSAGRPTPLRPIVLTHANDQTGRVFIATQHGVVHVLPNDQAAKQTKVFLDIQSKVRYDDRTNEEGFLGLTFHPDYKRTGEVFAFYTLKEPGHVNVLSRFRVSKDDPDRADPASEEELLRVTHKYWNHDGGTVVFGPDGHLYLALGDGGAANDPDSNGQNLNTLLAKILRIDVNRKEGGKPYAIPKDNPFAGRPDARPEVFAYGLRNVWRMAFDRATGRLWAADVGQNLYEEIDLIEKGGNYGWSVREGLHPFGAKGVGPRPDVVEPIWEYHHDVGKSITGGAVYRGSRFPELVGMYLYADYVSGKIWALKYDEAAKRVVANRPIRDRGLPIMSFGEDDRGELYLMTFSQSGRGVYRFTRPKNDPATGAGR